MNTTGVNVGWDRRGFLKLTGGAMLYAGSGGLLAQTLPYRVGVGSGTDPYGATIRAIEATADWTPALTSGRRVIIKPNLVVGISASTGTITDPEVTRAIVDLALRDGASEVLIIEAGTTQAYFTECGYDFFSSYDPDGRVRLVDLATQPVILVDIPRGLAYRKMYLPALIFEPNTILVSAAKLKVHTLAQATLSMKNMFGLPPQANYLSPGRTSGRYALHDRSVNESTVDINLARPIDFAVVDGIVGMERIGPYGGDPVQMNLVVAGKNALAVDLACLAAIQLPLARVQHLQYARSLGLGPSRFDQIEMRGDTVSPRAFVQTPVIPLVTTYPKATPAIFAPNRGEATTIQYTLGQPGYVRVEIVLTSETKPDVVPVRVLRDWTAMPAGPDVLAWDGRDEAGVVLPTNRYGIRVTTKSYDFPPRLWTIGWVGVRA